MSYFSSQNLSNFKQQSQWEDTLRQIQNWVSSWPSQFSYRRTQWRTCLEKIDDPIEVKALHVFTLARRLVKSAFVLASEETNTRTDGNDIENWHLRFVETSSLLFPMLELVGIATLASHSDPIPTIRLATGARWMNDPTTLPPQRNKPFKAKDDTTLLASLDRFMDSPPIVEDLILIRNYFLHGVAAEGGSKKVTDIMSFQIPYAIGIQAERAMREYWKQLQQDDGQPDGWLHRLARSKIEPFLIPGSNLPGTFGFEAGLIDPDIVFYLQNPSQSIFSKNKAGPV